MVVNGLAVDCLLGDVAKHSVDLAESLGQGAEIEGATLEGRLTVRPSWLVGDGTGQDVVHMVQGASVFFVHSDPWFLVVRPSLSKESPHVATGDGRDIPGVVPLDDRLGDESLALTNRHEFFKGAPVNLDITHGLSHDDFLCRRFNDIHDFAGHFVKVKVAQRTNGVLEFDEVR